MNLQAVGLLARTNLRRRGGSLALLAVLVALVSGIVLAGLAGAHRTATVLDRFLLATDQGDLRASVEGLAAADAPEFFTAVPGVRDAASVDVFLAQPTREGVRVDFTIVSSPDGRWGTDINRVLVRDGRMPAADRADEVALNRAAAEALGLGVGDQLEAQTISPEAFQRLITGRGGFTLDGPAISPTIVGVIEAGEDLQGSTQQSAPLALASPEFGRRYGGEIAVDGSTTVIQNDDPGTAERVRSAVASFPQTGVATAEDYWIGTTRSAINVMTIGLVIFAGIALLAGAIAVGQTISRQLSPDVDTLMVTRAMGLTGAERMAAGAAPVFGAAVVGSLLGVAIAVGASGLFPMAIARAAETSPGRRVDPLVIGGGWLLLTAMMAGWTLVGARRADRRIVSPSAPRSTPVLPAVLGIGSSVAPTLGVRLALDRDGGRANLPTRSTLFGAAVAVVGVVAVVVFASSLSAALDTPADFGWTWSTRPDVLSDAPPAAVLNDLAAEPDLQAVGAVFTGDAEIGAEAVPLQAFASVKGSLEPPVKSGRLPTSPSEVALGSTTLETTARSVGDSIAMNLPGGEPRDFTVVGEVVGNQMTETPDLGAIAVVTPEAAADLAGVDGLPGLLGSSFKGDLLLTYRDGVSQPTLEARLEADHQLSIVANYSRPTAPGRLLNMEDMRSLLIAIVAFFAAIGTLALVHLLVVSTRRRARELGTLRALGLVRRQLRSTIWVQALTIIGVGLLVGLPVGVVIGRRAWRATLSGVGMIASPTTPRLALAGLVVIAVTVTSLISLVPGSWAARARPAAMLRAE